MIRSNIEAMKVMSCHMILLGYYKEIVLMIEVIGNNIV